MPTVAARHPRAHRGVPGRPARAWSIGIHRQDPNSAASTCSGSGATEEGEIDRSPMERMKPPMVPEQPVEVIDESDLRADGTPSRQTSRSTVGGIPPSSACSSTPGCVPRSWRATTADIDATAGVVKVMGKGRRGRTVPFGKKTAVALRRYQRERSQHRSRRGRPTGWASSARSARGSQADVSNAEPPRSA